MSDNNQLPAVINTDQLACINLLHTIHAVLTDYSSNINLDILSACKQYGITYDMLTRAISDNNDISYLYKSAMLSRAKLALDDSLLIVNDDSRDVLISDDGKYFNTNKPTRDKLRSDSRFRYAALLTKLYDANSSNASNSFADIRDNMFKEANKLSVPYTTDT